MGSRSLHFGPMHVGWATADFWPLPVHTNTLSTWTFLFFPTEVLGRQNISYDSHVVWLVPAYRNYEKAPRAASLLLLSPQTRLPRRVLRIYVSRAQLPIRETTLSRVEGLSEGRAVKYSGTA